MKECTLYSGDCKDLSTVTGGMSLDAFRPETYVQPSV